MTPRVLVTGGSGLLGRAVLRKLTADGTWDIITCSRTDPGIARVRWIPWNVLEDDWERLGDGFQAIVHLIALAHERFCTDFRITMRTNVEATGTLLSWAEKQESLRVCIHLSSMVVTHPEESSPVKETARTGGETGLYPCTKLLAESLAERARLRGVPVISFRLANIYGPRPHDAPVSPFLLPRAIDQGLQQGEIVVDDFTPVRDWIFFEDAAEAVVRSLRSPPPAGIYNLGTGIGHSVGEVIGEAARQLGIPSRSRGLPTTGRRELICDTTKLTRTLDWQARTPIASGIAATIADMRAPRNP